MAGQGSSDIGSVWHSTFREELRKMLQVVEERCMQSRSEEFRAHAAECRELASHVRDLELKRRYEELARQWLELAERAERARPQRASS